MFWFLVAAVLLVLWLNQREQTKKAYEQGQRDVKSRIEHLVREDAVSKQTIQEALNDTAPRSLPTFSRYTSPIEMAGTAVVPVPEHVPIPLPPQHVTQEKLAADAARRTLQNLNTMLYVGSFLIVAAAALFINLTMPVPVKLACIMLTAASFYVAGLAVYSRSVKLRPAAIAFVGTGLAILPFAGYALYGIGGVSADVAWLLTSVVGVVAYAIAAMRIQSQLVSYITMAFVLSFSLSAVSTLGLALVWYYIAVIGVALVCNCIHILWPKALPNIFWKPVEQTGLVMTPLVLGASLVTTDYMDIFMYEILFSVASLYYVITWLLTRRWTYELITRVLAHITGLLVAADLAHRVGDITPFAAAWLFLAIFQAFYSFVRTRQTTESETRESVAVASAVGLMVVNTTLWLHTAHQYEWIALVLTCIGAVTAVATWRFRQFVWLYGCMVVSVALPLIVLREVATPAVGFDVIAIIFAMLGSLAVFGLERVRARYKPAELRHVLITASSVYIALIVLSGMILGTPADMCWTFLVAAGLTIMLSFLASPGPIIELIGGMLLSISLWAGTLWLVDGSNIWRPLIAVIVSTAAAAAISVAHHSSRQIARRDLMATLAVTLFVGVVFVSGSGLAVQRTAVILLLFGGIGLTLLRAILPKRGETLLSMVAMVGYMAYPVLAVLLSIAMPEQGWFVLSTAVLASLLWASSYIEKQPIVMAFGHGVLLLCVSQLWSWLGFDADWTLFGVAWLTAGIFYGWYWFAYDRRDSPRQQVALVATVLALCGSAIVGMASIESRWVIAGSGSVLALAAVVAIQGYLEKNRQYLEVAAYAATLGAQRTVYILVPGVNLVVFGHWWAMTVGLMAMWRGDDTDAIRPKIALSFVTLSTGIYALAEGGIYSLLFLVEHLMIAVGAILLGKQWAMWWGIAASILAILYFLRDYTALALLFLGFLIVLFVIWRLLRAGEKRP